MTHPWKNTPCARPPETDAGVVSVPIHKRDRLWNVGHVRPSESGDRLLHPKHRGVLLNNKEGVGGSLNLGLIHRSFLSAPSPSHRLGAFCVSGGIPSLDEDTGKPASPGSVCCLHLGGFLHPGRGCICRSFPYFIFHTWRRGLVSSDCLSVFVRHGLNSYYVPSTVLSSENALGNQVDKALTSWVCLFVPFSSG